MARKERPRANGHSKVISMNRRAYHDYDILETVEAGLVLTGTEIKSVRAAKMNIQHAFARVEGGEMWLLNAHIAPYAQGNIYNHEPTRPRKLLLHNKEIGEMAEAIKKVCEDSAYRQKLAQGGPKHAKNFSWESSTKKHMDLFESVLN